MSFQKIFMPTFSIGQLRSRSDAADFGSGNMTDFKRAVEVLVQGNVKGLCLLPITETSPENASAFGRVSSNALTHRILDLREIPEIRNDPDLLADLEADLALAQPLLYGPRQNLALVEMMHPKYLKLAFERFRSSPSESRRKELVEFREEQAWWLQPYAYFKVLEKAPDHKGRFMEEWNPDFADPESPIAKEFTSRNDSEMQYHQYVQMETYRQVQEAFQYALERGMEEIELLIGVGVDRQSAEGFLMKDLFNPSRQIGCFPEPENGYPLQLWGFMEEQAGPGLLEFKTKCFRNAQGLGVNRIGIDHACGFLGGYITFPVFDPESLEKGWYRTLDPAIPKDAEVAEAGGKWEIPRGLEKKRLEHSRTVLLSLLEQVPGMKLTAETIGDARRRRAAEVAIKRAIKGGYEITLMRALPWEKILFNQYGPEDSLCLTHDMPALIGLLTGQIGLEKREWIDGEFVSGFLRRLGVLAPILSEPLDMSNLTPEFILEIEKRISSGSEAGTVIVPLPTLYNLLPKYLNTGLWQYVNILPGSPASVGNEYGNWETRLPDIEDLEEVLPEIREVASRGRRPFGIPSELIPRIPNDNFAALAAPVLEAPVLYQGPTGKWTFWEDSRGRKPLLEIAISYGGPPSYGGFEGKEWITYDASLLGFQPERTYLFKDLVSGGAYPKRGDQLLSDGLTVGLNASSRRQHFVVYEE
ncbi:MAG: 4-alpha-glucanotransferase [Armatimonadetes bacterium]|nr:4-alpha-glucanotransferase [Armatimonadota bacterium]